MILNNQCRIVNIVWIERGIIITIIYYILKKYILLLNRTIIIDNIRYCKFFKILFPKLNFEIFKKHNNDNFYFNIRKVIRYQDIIIDYLANYTKIINTKKISLLPWYDMNDPIIIYQVHPKYKIKIKKYKYFIINFNKCKRGNYRNKTWDYFIELRVLKKYLKFNKKISFFNFFNILNTFLKSTYTDTVLKPRIYYINNQSKIMMNTVIEDNAPELPIPCIESNKPNVITSKDDQDDPDIPLDVCTDTLITKKAEIEKLSNIILANKLKQGIESYGINITDYVINKINALKIYLEILKYIQEKSNKDELMKRIEMIMNEINVLDNLGKALTSSNSLIDILKSF